MTINQEPTDLVERPPSRSIIVLDDATSCNARDAPSGVPGCHLLALGAKRAIDLVVASLGLVIGIPLIVVIAIAIKAADRGPVLFRQQRVGRSGRLFTMFKFRTMKDGTDAALRSDPEQFATFMSTDFKLPADDPRITAVGRLLRKLSIDELPQLFNVMRADMSLVGIRPIEPEQFDLRSPGDRAVYTTFRPGLTGLWQINGRSRMDPLDRLVLDRRYVEAWSLGLDASILVRTPFAILRVGHTH